MLKHWLPVIESPEYQAKPWRLSSKPILIGAILVVLAFLVMWLDTPMFGDDFWPIYLAGELALKGQSPYGVETTRILNQQWSTWSSQGGIGYPLPYILLIAPLTLLPYTLIASILCVLFMTAGYQAIRLNPQYQKILFLPLCFAPFMANMYIIQATLLVFALMFIVAYGIQTQRPRLVASILPFLMIKPQMGTFFVLYGLWWVWRNYRHALLWFGVVGAILLGASFAFQPKWIPELLKQVAVYNRVVEPVMLLPLGLVVILAVWRTPWWVFWAVVPIMVFPLTDFYSTLAILFFWIYVGGWPAYVGALCSWLWFLPNAPSTEGMIWAVVFIPVLTYTLLKWQYQRQQARQAKLTAPR